jgi:GT2 family glycosyltransferase
MPSSESVTLNSLQTARSHFQRGQEDVSILLYDNTPGGQDPGELPAHVRYKADPDNGGLAKAYNYALDIADQEGFDWLLTLDQDTALPADFLCKLCATIKLVAPTTEVAAIVPHIFGDGIVISPSIPRKRWLEWKHFPDDFGGISMEKLTLAVNSASTLRVSALRTIGGYDPRYWMDFSDVLLFYRLQSRNLRVFIAGDIRVEHEASVSDLMNRTTPGRYESIHQAEEAFYDECLGRIERVVLLLKLAYRFAVKLARQRASPPYFKVGLRFLGRRLFYSRKHRMADWNKSDRLQSSS